MAHKIFPKELGSLIPLLKEPFCTVRFGKQNNIWDENNQDHPFHLEQNFQTSRRCLSTDRRCILNKMMSFLQVDPDN